MNYFLKTPATMVALLIASASPAGDWRPLSGDYAMTGAEPIDPAPDADPRSHLRIHLTGQTARELYQALNAPVQTDPCTDRPARIMGNIRCIEYRRNERYECDFSIDLDNQRLDHGLAC